MKRFVFMVVFLFCLLAMGKGVEKGQLFLSSQVGVTSWSGPAFQFKLDHAISRSFSLGVSYEQRQYGEKWNPGFDSWNELTDPGTEHYYTLPGRTPATTSRTFTLEGTYHLSFIPVKRLDVFTGLGIGIDFQNNRNMWSSLGHDPRQYAISTKSQYFSQQAFIGFNYFLTTNAGLGCRLTLHNNPYEGWKSSAMMGFFLRLK